MSILTASNLKSIKSGDFENQSVLELKNFLNNLISREIQNKDIKTICSWVSTTEELRLVSSNYGKRLTNTILDSWTHSCEKTVLLADYKENEPVGFCTLSRSELKIIPNDFIEICHLIVAPKHRYLFAACHLLREAKNIASLLGYKWLIGRTIPENKKAIALASYCDFVEIHNMREWLEPGFRWFEYKINKNDY